MAKLRHIALIVPDPEKAAKFFEDAFDMKVAGKARRGLYVSDGTVNGSIQVPGNGAPIVLMKDRGTSGGYPKIATVISADLGRFAQTPAGHGFRFKAIGMAEAQAEFAAFAKLLHTLPDRLRDTENFALNLEALQDANVAGAAVSAIDARTWQVLSPSDAAAQN